MIKKKFELNIVLPLGINLIYPKKEDLVKGLYNVPGIVAGNFKEKKYGDYIVNIRPNIKNKEDRIIEIIATIDYTLVHFESVFSDRHEKPKIIFLPFKGGLYGKSINNIIILNERLLNDTYINSKTLIHETLHLWWGDNSVHFENRVITEGIVEFLSLNYLKELKKQGYLNHLLSRKKDGIKDVKKYNLEFDKIAYKKTYNSYCYSLLPLLLWSKNGDNNASKILIDFYKKNRNSSISNTSGNKLLEKIGIPIKN